MPRSLPLRDIRDLALAVIEGAVAAESLAKELRRTPDRSQHFQEIAERLRAVVSRPSIRSALADDGTEHIMLSRSQVPRPSAPAREHNHLHEVPREPAEPFSSPQLDRIEAILQGLPSLRVLEGLESRLAHIEQVAGRAIEGERLVVRSTEEALGLVARLVERLKYARAVLVRLELER